MEGALRPAVADLTARLAQLARELAPQLESSLAPESDPTQLGPLAGALESLLHALPSADARHHRYRLVRDCCHRLRQSLPPLIEMEAAASPSCPAS